MNLISIITINLNNAIGLENTLASIEKQTYKNIELIVIDGGSTDNSLKIIENYNSTITKAVIERDEGLYDAMNKGKDYASGDFALFLNSGDVLSNSDSLKTLTSKIDSKNKLYFGRAENIFENKTIYYMPSLKITENNYSEWLSKITPSHQTILFPKSFYKVNTYDLKYKIASDVDYKLRAINEFETIFIDAIVVNFELGGISTIPSSMKLINQIISEGLKISKKNHNAISFNNTLIPICNQYIKYFFYKILGEKQYFKLLKIILN